MIKFDKNNMISRKANINKLLEVKNEDNFNSLNILKPKSSLKCISKYNKIVNKITTQLSSLPLNNKDMCIIKNIIDLDIVAGLNLNEDSKVDFYSSTLGLN